MGWPAVRRFGAWAVLGTAACWAPAAPPPTAPENHAPPAASRDLVGSYACAIAEDGYRYGAFECAIRRVGGHLELAKLAGSQRFVGRVTPRPDGGFGFDGKLFCPYGSCDQALHGSFAPAADGRLAGTFSDNSMTVTLSRAQVRGGFGGDGYGGGEYGGNPYGGGTIPRP